MVILKEKEEEKKEKEKRREIGRLGSTVS